MRARYIVALGRTAPVRRIAGKLPALWAVLRKVKQQAGLNIHRLIEATAEVLDSYMRRERKSGRPVRLMHMAIHASYNHVYPCTYLKK